MTKLSALCETNKLKAEVKYGAPQNPEFKDSHPWTVTLKYQGRQYTVPFYTGPAIQNEPSAADVIACLLMDVEGIKSSGGFEEWARDLGYDPDSRRAKGIYNACRNQVEKVERLLGEDYELFVEAAQDY